jgi:hypothetical protein
MFSQFNDRLSSLEDVVSRLQASMVELETENTKLKEHLAKLLPKPVEDEPAVAAPEAFTFKSALPKPVEDEPIVDTNPPVETFMFQSALPKPVEDEPAVVLKPLVEVFMSALESVPERSGYSNVDDRRKFFTENANSEKYYYMPVGDIPQNPHRNTLVPLGKFLGFVNIGGQIPISDDQYSSNAEYKMRFSNWPFNEGYYGGAIHMSTGPLLYTHEPPASESDRLHYYDYIQFKNPAAFDENGRPNPLYAEQFPTGFGDGITGWGVQMIPYRETEQLRHSINGAANFIAKKRYVYLKENV